VSKAPLKNVFRWFTIMATILNACVIQYMQRANGVVHTYNIEGHTTKLLEISGAKESTG
jgi:hypothetical protein